MDFIGNEESPVGPTHPIRHTGHMHHPYIGTPVMADQVKSGAYASPHFHGETMFLCKRRGPWIPQSEQQSMERGVNFSPWD